MSICALFYNECAAAVRRNEYPLPPRSRRPRALLQKHAHKLTHSKRALRPSSHRTYLCAAPARMRAWFVVLCLVMMRHTLVALNVFTSGIKVILARR
ncbi:hypothetical protein EON66_00190 [archaeon]|nr:MAG: hypothetical protein EON66_00190 [archaeon]